MTSNRPFVKVLFLLALISAGFWVASQFPDLVITLIISALAAFVLKPVVTILEFRLGMRRSIAIATTFASLLAVLTYLSFEVLPLLVDGVKTMYAQVKVFPFEQKLNQAAKEFAGQSLFVNAEMIVQKVNAALAAGTEAFGSMLGSAAGFLVNLAILPFITYFILAEWDDLQKKLIEKVPNKYFEMTLNVINRIEKDLVGYMRGWILDSIIICLLSVVGYAMIGVDYPILIGVIAGVANLVPYLGPIVGAVPAFMVSVMQYGDFSKALPIVLLTFAIQMIDNTIVQPLCFSKSIDMHPVTVILVLIIGNEMMGVAGMVVAIPLFTILKASATETYWGLKNYRITA
jgi:predicted PurR-regulated permease PerM